MNQAFPRNLEYIPASQIGKAFGTRIALGPWRLVLLFLRDSFL